MGTVLDFGDAVRAAKGRPSASFGLVTELVARDEPAGTKGREGVIHQDGVATVCLVEQVPAVGDVIWGPIPAIVDDVRVTRQGRVLIYARPVPAHGP